MAPKKQIDCDEVMIVNDSPGEECRIAILQNGHLEELFTERTATATDVGNIYKGRVINVEPAIQAAFIDYGQGVNGFLHISDLHPKYFPGEERTERVGKKIPRRDRPPIQAALRRGQEILVQVLKEGIGTKGPTLTSYLSLPGRLLVLMPDMDRVGVSRKVEDEEKRREMRKILDSLDLPEGFGFILRTAGYGKTKTELKRDAAYLLRLWRMMEKRMKSVGAPCELYTESDLLIRTVRDVLRPSIKAIVVDSKSAYERASTFLRVVSPRSAPKVIFYNRPAPIFHAFDIERQIELIHSREVPLPSGGRLVIDQTEALVAIDVNSGKSRSARDSETNAYETNVEAADEICRQLRLRDLGGLIVNDLIDMRSPRHRQQIEERFNNNLKRDRAKATALKISEFGILEMTRQRMRPSIRKSHFMACPHCIGRGEIKVPEYVAADAARHIGFLLQYERVSRVEIACSPRVASVLLSGKRRELVRLEDATGKRIDVRVSDAIAMDRVDYYAYDNRNADIDITKLPPLQIPSIDVLEAESVASEVETASDHEIEMEPQKGGRRRRKRGPVDSAAMALDDEFNDFDELDEEESTDGDRDGEVLKVVEGDEGEPQQEFKRRRKRGRRGRGGKGRMQEQAHAELSPLAPNINGAAGHSAAAQIPDVAIHQNQAQHPEQGNRKRRGRRRRRGERAGAEDITPSLAQSATNDAASTSSEISNVPIDGDMPTGADAEHPLRIHELARELNVTSREVIERCEPDPAIHHVANALSTVSAQEADAIRSMFSNGEPAAEEIGTAQGEHVQPTQPGGSRRSRRRRGRRGRGGKQPQEFAGQAGLNQVARPVQPSSTVVADQTTDAAAFGTANQSGDQAQKGRRSRRRRRGRRGGGDGGGGGNGGTQHNDHATMSNTQSSTPPADASHSNAPAAPAQTAEAKPQLAPAKKRRRALYRAGRVAVSTAAREGASDDE